MQFIEKNWKGMLLCLIISTPCWFLGKSFPLIGGPVFSFFSLPRQRILSYQIFFSLSTLFFIFFKFF